ncbi:hypothetical protein MPF19_12175 [Polaribacter sp. Z014]|uniref:hypothetical protein n=1 Tax=unclassified Polaribacter TaxID=196858 RepID=UPI00193B6DDD|nr:MULTISPECIES: hypothetical protein [unclassified Polaribacter]MCL7764176.1 hypothetical protein [Polaribacter sp. Z014]QVY65758.1 hypothetical protein JOP69_00255 [Polaribacter sp. Q13]
MKRKILFLTLLFSVFYGFSQSVNYIDEKMKSIDSITYYKKCNSVVLKCLNFKTDSLNINKVVYKFKFGTTDSIGYSQVRTLLLKNSNRKIHKNAFLMISYRDTLFNTKAIKESFIRHTKTHKTLEHKDFNSKKYHFRRQKWVNSQKKCREKFNKLGAETFYVFKYDYGYMKEYNDIKWIKDRGLFKNAFFKIIYSGNFLIIKPDGKYFISGGHLPNNLLKKLLKNEDWSKLKLDWLATYNTLSKSGIGAFKENSYHKKHCF